MGIIAKRTGLLGTPQYTYISLLKTSKERIEIAFEIDPEETWNEIP